MTVQELISELEQMNPEAEVFIASQPEWPFEYDVEQVKEIHRDDCDPDEPMPMGDEQESIVYIAEGEQLAYLNTSVAANIGWGHQWILPTVGYTKEVTIPTTKLKDLWNN